MNHFVNTVLLFYLLILWSVGRCGGVGGASGRGGGGRSALPLFVCSAVVFLRFFASSFLRCFFMSLSCIPHLEEWFARVLEERVDLKRERGLGELVVGDCFFIIISGPFHF